MRVLESILLTFSVLATIPNLAHARPGQANIFGVTKRRNIYGMKGTPNLRRGNNFGANGRSLRNSYPPRNKAKIDHLRFRIS